MSNHATIIEAALDSPAVQRIAVKLRTAGYTVTEISTSEAGHVYLKLHGQRLPTFEAHGKNALAAYEAAEMHLRKANEPKDEQTKMKL